MKHFLVTRFNIRFKDWKTTKNGEKVLTDEWMRHRLRLFENYCLPSVINQSNQNFVWCIFFDKETMVDIEDKIQYFKKKCKNIYPIYLNDASEMVCGLVKAIKNNTTKKDKFIITTRLDNDDILHKDFIKTIQNNFTPIHNTVIDLKAGFQVHIKRNNPEIREFDSPFNQFISVVEDITQIRTVLSKQHLEWKNSKSIISIEKPRLWIEVVHHKNKLSQVLSYHKRTILFDNKNFGLSNGNIFVENPLQVGIHNIWISTISPMIKGLKWILSRWTRLVFIFFRQD